MDGFFHSIDDVQREVRDAGLILQDWAAIEGPAWMCADFDAAWADPQRREWILELARLAERAPEVISTSPHIAFVASVERYIGRFAPFPPADRRESVGAT